MAGGREPQAASRPFDALPDALLGHIQALAGLNAEAALVSRRWWRCWLAEPSLWEHMSVHCYAQTADQWERQLEGWMQRAGHVGRHACQLELDVWSSHHVVAGRTPGILDRRLPQLLGCLSPGRLRMLVLQPTPLTDGMAEALQRLAPRLEWLAFGSTESALPATHFCQLAGHLSSLECLELAASHVAPSVLAALAALSRLNELQLESHAALPDARQLSALTRLLRLELQQSEHVVGPLRVPSAAQLLRLTRLALGANDMQLPSGERCSFRDIVGAVEELHHLVLERTNCGLLLIVQYADLDDGHDEQGDCSPLAALWRTVLPGGAAVQEVLLFGCAIHSSAGGSSFSGCSPLLASVTTLSAFACPERTVGTDAALRRAFDALIALAPNLRILNIINDGPDEPGWTLTAGLPPAVLALRYLESLSLAGCRVPALPGGPYLAGLTRLDLSSCRLSGPVPPALQAAARLQSLCLAGNSGLQLADSSVAMLSGLPALTRLQLSRQQTEATPSVAAQLAALAPPAGKLQVEYHWF